MLDTSIAKWKKEQQREKIGNPYLECRVRAFFSGVAAFGLSSSCTYFLHKLLPKRFHYKQKYHVMYSLMFGGIVGYKVAGIKSDECYNLGNVLESVQVSQDT